MATSVDCGMLFKQIVDSITKRSNNELRKNNLTLSQIRYLSFIYEYPFEKVSLKVIENHFDVAQPTVAGIMARMVKKDLVFMEQDVSDSRAKTVSLTDKGVAIYLESVQSRDDTEALLLSPLTEAEQLIFRDMLNRINNRLKTD